jgi:gamma-glutamyltranspeptidase / glutathione hydrolase
MFTHQPNSSTLTGLSSGVPGDLRGLAYLHEHYGSLPWEQVVMPAVNVARNGFPVTEDLIRYRLAAFTMSGDFITTDPSWAIDFAPNGTLMGLGEIMTRRRYAVTLETIAKRGPDAFYHGPIAEATINALQAKNGIMTLKDLADYRVVSRPAPYITYRDYRIVSGGAPSSGVVALTAMKIMEGFDSVGTHGMSMNLSTHYFDEAIRFGQGKRTELGDPAFVAGLDQFQEGMLDEKTVTKMRSKINPLHTLPVSDYDPSGYESMEDHGTSAIVTSDASGMAISLTTTINLLFGNQIMVPETGVVLNNVTSSSQSTCRAMYANLFESLGNG